LYELENRGYGMDEQVKAQIKLALAVCAHDGLISDAEIAFLRSHYCGLGRITESEMERIIDAFFDEDESLEELICAVDNIDYALRVSEEAASSDGLDIKENFALERCYRITSEKNMAEKSDVKGD
jgi:hypothetical protein